MRLFGQFADLICNHGKSAAMLTRTRGLDSSVERQKIGLICDGGDILCQCVDIFHNLC